MFRGPSHRAFSSCLPSFLWANENTSHVHSCQAAPAEHPKGDGAKIRVKLCNCFSRPIRSIQKLDWRREKKRKKKEEKRQPEVKSRWGSVLRWCASRGWRLFSSSKSSSIISRKFVKSNLWHDRKFKLAIISSLSWLTCLSGS